VGVKWPLCLSTLCVRAGADNGQLDNTV